MTKFENDRWELLRIKKQDILRRIYYSFITSAKPEDILLITAKLIQDDCIKYCLKSTILECGSILFKADKLYDTVINSDIKVIDVFLNEVKTLLPHIFRRIDKNNESLDQEFKDCYEDNQNESYLMNAGDKSPNKNKTINQIIVSLEKIIADLKMINKNFENEKRLNDKIQKNINITDCQISTEVKDEIQKSSENNYNQETYENGKKKNLDEMNNNIVQKNNNITDIKPIYEVKDEIQKSSENNDNQETYENGKEKCFGKMTDNYKSNDLTKVYEEQNSIEIKNENCNYNKEENNTNNDEYISFKNSSSTKSSINALINNNEENNNSFENKNKSEFTFKTQIVSKETKNKIIGKSVFYDIEHNDMDSDSNEKNQKDILDSNDCEGIYFDLEFQNNDKLNNSKKNVDEILKKTDFDYNHNDNFNDDNDDDSYDDIKTTQF